MKTPLLKSFLCVLIATIATAGWGQPNYTRLATAKTFSPLPLIATGKVTDLILAGDSVPHAYIRTHIVEVDFSAFVSSNDLIKAIQAKGKEEGVDGILLLGLGDNRPPTESYTPNNRYNNSKAGVGEAIGNVVAAIVSPNITYNSGFSSIKGIGIKYIDGINYLDAFLKKRTIQILDKKEDETSVINLRYDINGTLFIDGNNVPKDKFFTDSIMPFDIQMALNQQSNNYEKKFSKDVDTDKPFLSEIAGKYGVQNVSYHMKDLQKKVFFKAVVENEIEYASRGKYEIYPSYNANNNLNGATVFKDGKPLFVISYQLSNKNTVQQEDWQKWENGKLIPWVKITNEYFSNDAYKNGFQ